MSTHCSDFGWRNGSHWATLESESVSWSVMPILCDLMDCSPPNYTKFHHGILQARRLEWVAIPFSRGSSLPRDWIWGCFIADRFFTIWATKEALLVVAQLVTQWLKQDAHIAHAHGFEFLGCLILWCVQRSLQVFFHQYNHLIDFTFLYLLW